MRLTADITQSLVYLIGDVHGCHDQLIDLEGKIVRDAANFSGRKQIVMLGDYVDRGPQSAQVIDHLASPPPEGFERTCLTGNHEIAMLDYLDGRISLAAWLPMGANATLLSYGVDLEHLSGYRSTEQLDEVILSVIPDRHVDFLRSLPILVDAGRFLFVHAGIRPGTPLDQQTDDDLVFIRGDFYNATHLLERWVVHGHTPIDKPQPEGRRINIDTGAFYTGRLTALRLWKNKGRVLST
ncbi:MAG: metallophosphoesterase [Phyllobacterium sp.]